MKIQRLGEKSFNKYGEEMYISEYKGALKIKVRFSGHENVEISTSYDHFLKGDVKNPFRPNIRDVGYIGVGNYTSRVGIKITPQYRCWENMLNRCYNSKKEVEFPNYIDCSVSPEWHNFQNFAKWYDDNFYQIPGDIMTLDKDILIKGNRIYGPDTCCFVTSKINKLFLNRKNDRGKYPVGISRSGKKYRVYCNVKNKRIELGKFFTIEEAFQVYKNFKESLIKETAERYKNFIPEKLYKALLNYKIEITD